MTRVLCHVGPWCKNHFHAIARGFDEQGTVRFISGFASVDDTGLPDRYHELVRGASAFEGRETAEERDMILRCRLLRMLGRDEALRHLRAMRQAIGEALDRERPDLVICESIDQFAMDLLRVESHARGVPFIGLIRTFVNGYFRISARGEFVRVREPDAEEVDRVLGELLDPVYLPSNLVPIRSGLRRRSIRVWGRNLIKPVYFRLKRMVGQHPYNYHDWSTELVSRYVYWHWFPRLSLGCDDWRERVSDSGRSVVFIPLQHYPEATIDYWCDDLRAIDYHSALKRIIERLSTRFHVLVKEHPGVLGFRDPSVYKWLGEMSKVTIAPTGTPAQDCVDASDAVAIWTGSVGFEAALRGKPVLCFGTPYFASSRHFRSVAVDVPDSDLDALAMEVGKEPSSAEAREMMCRLLSGMFPGRFQNDGTFDPRSPDDVRSALEVGRCIREYLQRTGHVPH